MGKIIEIGICKAKGDEITSLNIAEAIKGEGIRYDRKCKKSNDKMKQITLIGIENIKYYNETSSTRFSALSFRRNIVTEGIELNDLLLKEFYVGRVKLYAHDLCRPCKYLQEILKKDNIIKEFLIKGGLRCEILSNGKISVGDSINI